MKLQVNVSDEMVEKIDFYSEAFGVSRSSLCAVWIGQGLMLYQEQFKESDRILKQMKK